MSFINEAFRTSTIAALESQGLNADAYKGHGQVVRGDALYAESDASALAYDWMERCKVSVASAQDVLKEIEITEHGEFVARAMWMLANVGIYTNRDKIVRELIDALEGTLLECAGHE